MGIIKKKIFSNLNNIHVYKPSSTTLKKIGGFVSTYLSATYCLYTAKS